MLFGVALERRNDHRLGPEIEEAIEIGVLGQLAFAGAEEDFGLEAIGREICASGTSDSWMARAVSWLTKGPL